MPDASAIFASKGHLYRFGENVASKCYQTQTSVNITSYRGRRAGSAVKERENLQQNQITTRISQRNTPKALAFETKSFVRRNLIYLKPEPLLSLQTGVNSKVALWNARSIATKHASMCDFVISEKLDILILTETWLKGDSRDDHVIAEIENTLPDHQLIHVPRSSGRGGGVAVIMRKGYSLYHDCQHRSVSFEHLDLSITSGSTSLRLLAVYRPPPSNKNHLNASLFFEEFSNMLETLAISSGSLLIAGDFNFHVDIASDSEASKFLELLESVNLDQHVHVPTHRHGHTLDLIITRSSQDLITSINTSSDLPSDHSAVICKVHIPRPNATKQMIKHRKLRAVNIDLLASDIRKSSLLLTPATDLVSLTDQYNSVLGGLLDEHAPKQDRLITLRPHAPWYNDSLKAAKQEKRRRERQWKTSDLEVHRQWYKSQCSTYQKLLAETKSTYHQKEISACDNKHLFRMIDKFIHPKKTQILPSSDISQNIPNIFADYFKQKIEDIRHGIDCTPTTFVSVNVPEERSGSSLSEFHQVTQEQVRSIVNKSPTKSCPLDPIPTSMLKDCLNDLLPTLTKIINLSLVDGVVPQVFKHARITPVIKKPTLDSEVLSNYRPVSNLPFLSKVLERIVATQLHRYLEYSKLYTSMQSAYRQYHSTETALLCVNNYLLRALDEGNEAVLILLDFSAAFDTIDHELLLMRLEQRFGVAGTVLNWFRSYLQLRTQIVTTATYESSCHPCLFGVPQGSVLGPVLFTLYVAPMEDLINAHGVKGVMYADDTQLFTVLKQPHHHDTLTKLEICIKDIKAWAISNKLKFNDSKTEVVHINSHFRNPSALPTIKIGEALVESVPEARDLGVILDKHLSLGTHVNNICRSSFLAIRNIGKIRKYLNQPTTERLVHAFITSRLDSCNSLLFGLPSHQLDKLQRVQNTAARLVTRTKRSQHITPVLEKLHWLPVRKRIIFKILCLTYKALHNLAPVYISNLVQRHKPQRALRSEKKELLTIPRTRTSTFGDRAFSVAAPVLWNALPINIKEAETLSYFKSSLKTHLFRTTF